MDSWPRIVGLRRLFCNGYIYILSKERNGTKYWNCKKLKNKQCKCRFTRMNGDEIVVIKG